MGNDQFHHRACTPAQRGAKTQGCQAIGRSRRGPASRFTLTPTHWETPRAFTSRPDRRTGLEGADALLPGNQGQTLIADKAYDAHSRVIEPLLTAGKKAVIPSRSANKERREYDKDLYKARHVIKNFLARLKQWRAITTRYDKTACNFLAAIHLIAAVIWMV